MEIYLRDPDGCHFYHKIEERKWLHICAGKSRSDQYLINTIPFIPHVHKMETSNKETFEDKMREAILNLEIWKYTVPKN